MRDNFKSILVFYFTCNNVWNWSKIISAAEKVLKLYQNYFSDTERVKIFMSCVYSLWNNFEIISGKFRRAEIKLFQVDVVEGWNTFEIIWFHT